MSSFKSLLQNGANGITGYQYAPNITGTIFNGSWEEPQQILPQIPDGVPQGDQNTIQKAVDAAKEYISHLNKILFSLTTYQTILIEYRKGNLLADNMLVDIDQAKRTAQQLIRQYETHYPIIMKYDEEIERLNDKIKAKKNKIRDLEKIIGNPNDCLD